MTRTLAVLSILLALAATASARKPEDVFGGQILISDQPFPNAAKSAEAFIDALKKQSRDRLTEDKESKSWHVFFAAFFKQPLNDLEISIRVYDTTAGAKRLVDTFEQYLGSATQRAYASSVNLKRGDGSGGYDPNTKILVVMENRGRLIAQGTFYIVGEVKKGPTKVDFSEPESQPSK